MASNTENVSIWWRHQVLCYWNSELIIKTKLKLESGNQKIQYSCRWPLWKWLHWKSLNFCLWPWSTCTWNVKFKFQSNFDLCSRNCRLQTDWRTRWIQYILPSNFFGWGYKMTTDTVINIIFWPIFDMSSHSQKPILSKTRGLSAYIARWLLELWQILYDHHPWLTLIIIT